MLSDEIPKPRTPFGGMIRAMDVGIFAAAIAIPLFVALGIYFKITALWLIFGLFGMAFFLPIGALIGWWIWDPYKRAQLLRWIKRRNYGVVNLVHRESGYMLPLVRDLNESVLIRDQALWVLRGGKIYRMDKKKEVIDIKPEHFVYVGGVPTLFLDVESKKPLTFKGHPAEEATPAEVGATILGYVYNQMTKAIASLKRQWNWMLIGMLVLSLVNAVMNYQIMSQLDRVQHSITTHVQQPPVQVVPQPPAETNTTAQNAQTPTPIPSDKGVAVGASG